MMRNHLGVDFAGTNATREARQLPAMSAGDRLTVDFYIDLPELIRPSSPFPRQSQTARSTLIRCVIG